MAIDHVNLARLDLNLLVALDALLEEGNVTRAAARTGVKQSAMSSSLARLRRMFGDELLTRTPTGMRPTPRGTSLVEPVRALLRQFQSLVRPEIDFDPSTLSRVIRLAVPDSIEVLLMPHVLARLSAEAPGVRLLLRSFERIDVLREIDADRLDLAIGVFDGGQVHHKQRLLYKDGYLCLFNATRLGIASPVSLEDYLRFPHVLTSLNETQCGVVDDALAKIGRRRELAIVTPRFLAVPFLVENAPMITTMVSRLATLFAEQLGLATSPVPVDLATRDTVMVWHGSYDRDPVHQWLRNLVVEINAEVGRTRSRPVMTAASRQSK